MTDRKTLTRRTLLGAGIVGVAGIAAAGIGLSTRPGGLFGSGDATTAASLQLSWLHSVQFGGSYIALDRGWYEGVDVTLLQGGPNAPVEPPVVSGSALIGISAADYTAAAVAEGAPFKIIGVAMQKNPFVIASLPENPVNEPADLVGKRIGMALANTPVLETLCTLNDVDVDGIEVVPTQYSAQPLLAGEVDCLLCWETDLPVAMTVQGVESVTMLMADYGYALHSQTYIATEESLANRRADLVALMRGEVRGWDEYRADTNAAAALTVETFPDAGLDLPTQELQAERQVPLMFSEVTDENGFGWWTDESVSQNRETLALLGQDVPADLWDRSVLEEVHGS
ncbi:ABC transporter substrate-binding protein [Microbacterium invictum]|uniref:Thiamine pyrimidine synthase n=1 Tax=Microbacterium invictum TaxID=515415 RepID=A0ABZ0V7T7_9MICO|nr:ABC transporter substrate-binding protein [Microbacterium invictum]WQB69686.1 ABC transporter substrate-binding protein [Microbacterium invictum]